MRVLPAVLLVSALALALAGCGGDDDSGSSGSGGSAAAADRGTPSGTADPASVTCAYNDPGYDATKKADKPPTTPTVGGEVKETMKTTIGDLHLTMDATKAPCTVNSIVSLTAQGWYDDSYCQRLTTTAESGIAVLQCGDPSGTGLSSPGYVFDDELTGSETYPAGTLAMANTGQPGTNAAQFFIVYADTDLPASYTVFGSVDAATVKLIADLAAQGTTVAKGGYTAPKKTVKVSQMVFG